MTAHEFARQLLAGPDLPICVPVVKEYDHDTEDMPAPVVNETDAETWNDKRIRVLVISYRK